MMHEEGWDLEYIENKVFLKKHGMFRQMFRGNYLKLRTFLKLTAHLTAANVRHAWAPEPFIRYPSGIFGPHAPAPSAQ